MVTKTVEIVDRYIREWRWKCKLKEEKCTKLTYDVFDKYTKLLVIDTQPF